MLLRHHCSITDTDFRAGQRKTSLILAMTSRLVCYFVYGTDSFRHGDGVRGRMISRHTSAVVGQHKKHN